MTFATRDQSWIDIHGWDFGFLLWEMWGRWCLSSLCRSYLGALPVRAPGAGLFKIAFHFIIIGKESHQISTWHIISGAGWNYVTLSLHCQPWKYKWQPLGVLNGVYYGLDSLNLGFWPYAYLDRPHMRLGCSLIDKGFGITSLFISHGPSQHFQKFICTPG